MVIVVFRSRLQPGVDLSALEKIGLRMYELASAMPGFISYKDYTAADEETLTLVEFDTEAHLIAWRDHPEHLAVQEEARRSVFAEYHITVCSPLRAYRYSTKYGRIELTDP